MRDIVSDSMMSSRQWPVDDEPLHRAVLDQHQTFSAEAALTEIARAIAGRSTAAEVAQVVVDEVRRLVPGDRSSVWRWLPGCDAIQLLAVSAGIDALGMSIGDVVPVDDGGFRSVLEAGLSMREADLGRHRSVLERALAADGQRSRLIVPVLVNGTPVGVLAATSARHGIYTEAHERLLEHLAVHLAVGLEQARLTAEARRHQERLLGLQRVAQRLAASVAGDDVLDMVLEEAVRSVGGDTGTLLTWDHEHRVLVPIRNTVPTAHEYTVLRPGQGVAGRAIQHGRVTVLDDYQRESGDETPAGKTGVTAAIGAPLVADGELLGAVTANTLDPHKRFDAADVQIFELYAGQAAAIFKSVRLFESERQRRRQVEAVRSVTAELTRELDLASLLDLILMWAGRFVRCDSSAVLLWDEDTATLIPSAWRGLGDRVTTARLGLGDGAAGTAAKHRAGIVVEDYRAWKAKIMPVPEEAGPTSVMAVPLIYQDRLIGVLTANRFDIAESFSGHDLELLDVFGTQAAVAIENARLFEQATSAEALRELAQLKAELLNTVSHELRTPLSLIHGYAELLVHRADQLGPADVAQMSNEIYTSSRTLARLVDDLLDFSHLDHGRLQLRRMRIVLGELLESLTRTFGTQPGGERIVAEIGPGLDVEADPERLHQVVGNLLTNALLYTLDGPIVVRATGKDGGVLVEVEDHGPGLAPEEVSRVWESFYRGAESAHLPNRGSGLGLTVVKQIVELHGGKVGVRGTAGGGATFWFTLPPA